MIEMELLLTIYIQHQQTSDENTRQISIKGLIVDLITNFPK